MARVAMCRDCGDQPLVSTMAWSRFEFYCVNCGAHLGWLEPVGAEETPELLERMRAVEAEFEALGGRDLLGGGMMRSDCPACKTDDEPHLDHCADEERAKHVAALERLANRVLAGAPAA